MSTTLKRAALILITTVVALLVGSTTANAAPSFGWDPIVRCESGNRNIHTGGNSTASGYFQILDSTWRSHGGGQFSSTAMGTSKANQQIVAERVLADQGLGAWGPSQSCWGGSGGVRKTAVVSSHTKAPVRHHRSHHRSHHRHHGGHHHS